MCYTVKPLLSGHVLSGHPPLNAHLSNFQKAGPLFTINLTSIKRTQSPFRITNWLILLYFTYIKQSHSQLVQEIARFPGVFGINTASDISKFIKISRAATAASDIWRVLKYHEPVFIPIPRRSRAISVYTTRQRNFALYVTAVIFTCKYFKFGLNTAGLSQSHFRNLSPCSITM